MSNKNSNFDSNKKANNLLNKVSEHLGQTPESLKKAMTSGDLSQSLKNISKEDVQKIQKVLTDKNLAAKLLSTPQAQKLMKDLIGDK